MINTSITKKIVQIYIVLLNTKYNILHSPNKLQFPPRKETASITFMYSLRMTKMLAHFTISLRLVTMLDYKNLNLCSKYGFEERS